MNGSMIRGLVLDEQDWPIEGASVSLSAQSSGGSAPDIGQVTDGSGRFVWADLAEGRYEVVVRAEGFHPSSAQTFAGVLTPARVDFHLTRIAQARRRPVQPAPPAPPPEQVAPPVPQARNPHEGVTYGIDEGGDLVEGSND